MHIIMGTRGIKHDVDRMITELSSQYLPFMFWGKDDKKQTPHNLQIRVCPIQLWDISFPEPHLDMMLNSLFGPGGGKPMNKKHEKYVYAIGRAMGVKPIPDYKKDKKLAFWNQNTEMIGIGIKKDNFTDRGEAI